MPVHVLVECPELIASARLGVIEPLKPLMETGECEVIFRKTRNVRKKHIQWADIVVCVRGCESFTLYLIREAKRLGRLIIYYLDDDLLHIPDEAISAPYYNDPVIRETMCKLLGMSDILWGVNDKIREIYGAMCPGRWVWNRMPINAIIKSNIGREDRINILYAGSPDHQKLVTEILTPVADMLSMEYPERVSFTFIGPSSGIKDRANVKNVSFFSDYMDYRNFVEKGNFAVGLAPIRTTEFYQCKYYNKFVEYASIGAVGVYTDCPLYRQVVTDGDNGFLCANTFDSWYQRLKTLIDNPCPLKHCRSLMQQQLIEKFNAEQVAIGLKTQLPELCSYCAPGVSLREVRLHSPWVLFYWSRVKLLWRQYFILAIPIVAWKVIKKTVRLLLKGIRCLV